MWRHIACSLQGPAHQADEQPCQDSSRVMSLGGDDAATWIACVADGAGSAAESAAGSKIACETMIAQASAYYDQHGSFEPFEPADATRWCDLARQTIVDVAATKDVEVRAYATTLCTAIVSPRRSIFFQIGDGAIVLRRQGVYGAVFWPQSGEYANSTNFLTQPAYHDRLEFHASTGAPSDVALLTDGIERLALNFQTQAPHLPFFDPLFTALRISPDEAMLEQSLRQFLSSEPVTSRSDDDKSLILASWIAPAGA